MKTQKEINEWHGFNIPEDKPIKQFYNSRYGYGQTSYKERVIMFLRRMFVYPFEEYGIVGTILYWFLKTGLVTLILISLLWAADSWFLPKSSGVGVVTNKYYKAPYTYYMSIHSGNTTTMIPQTIYESFNVVIDIDGNTGRYKTFESDYNDLKIGDSVKCTYHKGRILETIYIDE